MLDKFCVAERRIRILNFLMLQKQTTIWYYVISENVIKNITKPLREYLCKGFFCAKG